MKILWLEKANCPVYLFPAIVIIINLVSLYKESDEKNRKKPAVNKYQEKKQADPRRPSSIDEHDSTEPFTKANDTVIAS
jgi:hypothetical protein